MTTTNTTLCFLPGLALHRELEEDERGAAAVLARARSVANCPHLDGIAETAPRSRLSFPVAGEATRAAYRALGTAAPPLEPPPSLDPEDESEAAATLDEMCLYCLRTSGPLHLIGSLADRASVDRLTSVLARTQIRELQTWVHLVLDGRRGGPQAAAAFFDDIERACALFGASIASVSGRGFALDQARRWDTTVRALVAMGCDLGPLKAVQAPDARGLLQRHYQSGGSDDFLMPARVGDYAGMEGEINLMAGHEKPEWAWRTPGILLSLVEGTEQLLRFFAGGRDLPQDVENAFLKSLLPAPMRFFDQRVFSIEDEADGVEALHPRTTLAHPPWLDRLGAAAVDVVVAFEDESRAHYAAFVGQRPTDTEDLAAVSSPELSTEQPLMATEALIARATTALAASDSQLVWLDLAAPLFMAELGDEAACVAAIEAVDRGVGALVRAGGRLVLTATAADSGEPAGEASPSRNGEAIVWFIGLDSETRVAPEGTSADFGPTVLALAAPGSQTATGLVSRSGPDVPPAD